MPAIPTQALGIRDRALFELIYSCGLRVTEAVRLTVDRVSLAESVVRVLGKGARERLVPLGDRAKHELEKYLAESRPHLAGRSPSSVLFLGRGGRMLSRKTVWKIFKRLALQRRAGRQGSLAAALLRDAPPPGRGRPAVRAGAARVTRTSGQRRSTPT